MYRSTKLQIDFTIESSFDVHFGTLQEIFITDAELYKGDYAVKPEFTEQKLPTKNKLLTEAKELKMNDDDKTYSGLLEEE